ncbi:MAG TPA: bifunctional 4-hydroxy-2-oxoglutarate aldolase/2-dehydro-3-deoxy-phosphogluconate aldolase [Actinophytocola sp.]|uniref:bifunctional 4-hydroxy-2-oxoglutarate aldolase/2-dehydro-3-deoxy-phosphogluconate aldolase n=1 Tax=Actinophytocola sp. TaxID=1872138 RepID=UPI002DFFD907|nr:bifunctional 4-hydroxy-2-oxoglutarate aldolase/2-dehydro-3-deoxy-phosphogluconate aldolase [Actinophytocola sp.]
MLDISPVIPVAVIDDAGTAVPVARALVAGGVAVIEVTLRTPAALDAIRRIADEVPGISVGVGTVTTPAQLEEAASAGASFVVSPGCTPRLLDAMTASGLPCLPGAATVSEMLTLLEHGFTELKFFPATAAGGLAYLRSVAAPLPGLRFCPTGGLTPETAPDYLALPNVACVGGSWLTPADAIAAGDWTTIRSLAARAAALTP